MERAARFGFLAALVLAFAMAVVPHPPPLPGEPSDMIVHMLAFATLGGLAAYGFRGPSVALLFVTLTAFGAMIEILQAIPALNRDSEFADLVVDAAAALASLVAARRLIAWRERRP